MTIVDILNTIQKSANLNKKEISKYLCVKEKDINNWKKKQTVPSKYQVQNILHLATLFDIDISHFNWIGYIESVLEIVYNDEYRICDGIDENKYLVHLCRIDGVQGYVPIEDISNRKKDLFKNK